jgi:hypothetical protein
MQIIELYIKGYKRINGSAKSFATNKLIDSQAEFTKIVEVGDIVTNLRTQETVKITAIDSDTQLSIGADIFPSADIYRIESDYFRADLFEDESVVITDSVLNIKDIKKVFTPFSQQFNLPASKLNNKLFRHYENFNIENSFDARYRHDAIIKLNGIDYKKGQIQFQSVSLKDNKAHAYKVVFYGDAVELKEVLGDTKLSGLNYPSSLNFDYTQTNITNFFTASDGSINSTYGSTDILVPNIHHSKNMRYPDATTGYRDNITDTELSWVDLKPAIRCRAIIDAINNTYPQINLTGFFNSEPFSNIYMWLHKNEGFVSNAEEGGGTRISSNRFRNIDDSPNNFTFNAGLSSGVTEDVRTLFWQPPAGVNQYKIKAYVTTSTTQDFTVRIINSFNNYTYANETFSASSGTVSVETDYIGSDQNYPFDITLEVEAENNITMTQRLEITKRTYPFGGVQWTAVYDVDSPNVQNDFIISKQMPEMKVMDFLSGLFKMFNCVVYKDGDNIEVELSSVYMRSGRGGTGTPYDITKYVDMSTSTVERIFPHREMEFKFKSKKSFLVQYSDEIQGIPFSQENYPETSAEFDGSVYKVEVPFEKMMYERLSNVDTGAQTYIGQGAFLDKKFEPTIGEPLLFCIHYEANTNSELTIDGTTPSNYRRPSNMSTFNWGFNNRMQLNFGLEADEWLGELPISATSSNLFEANYLDYVQTVFDRKGRMLKVDAYLPLSIITQLKLNDQLIIANTVFRINSIKTNLLTNKSQLELYNKQEFASNVANEQFAYLARPTELQATSVTSGGIDISFKGNGDETDFNIYLDDGFFATIPSTGAPAVYNYTNLKGLESGTTYNISVRSKYDIDGNDAYSFDAIITETTL